MKHKKHEHHKHNSDEEDSTPSKAPLTLVQSSSEIKGTPAEDAKMREYIKNMHKKEPTTTPETYDYRIKTAIPNHKLHPSDVPHVVKQAEEEGKKAHTNQGQK